MRIATWNVERLKHKNRLDDIVVECIASKADILVLTETDNRIELPYRYCFRTSSLKGVTDPVVYADTENRVSIYTNFECIREHPTFDGATALCVELDTGMGRLLVYGTIIGILGNRRTSFKEDLAKQMDDIRRFSREGHHICMSGDYNCSFSDNWYYTTYGRQTLDDGFKKAGMSIVTREKEQCIDHIAISDDFIKTGVVSVNEWNEDYTLSDHKGIVADLG